MTQLSTLSPDLTVTGPGTVTYPLLDSEGDPCELLTIDELDQGSQLLRVDLMVAVQAGHPRRNLALAVTTWLLARRQDRKVQLAPFRQLRPLDLLPLLWPIVEAPADDDVDDQGDDELPELGQVESIGQLHAGEATEVATDDELAGLADDPLADELAARPTVPAPAP